MTVATTRAERDRLGTPRPPPGGELVRPRLVELLDRRWTHPVTLLAAGPGFGKTTLLAQATRYRASAPHGVDLVLECHAGHRDPAVLVRDLLSLLGSGPGPGEPLDRLRAGLTGGSPVPTCLVLDDVQRLGSNGPAVTLLSELLTELLAGRPARTHLLLSGRALPELSLGRLRAVGAVAEVDERQLALTDGEIASLASRLGRDPADAAELGGWPAMVRLALDFPGSPSWRYAGEEVLDRLSGPQRAQLAALAFLGPTDAAAVAAALTLPERSVDLEALADLVPLVSAVGRRTFQAHPLWREVLRRGGHGAGQDRLLRRCINLLRGQAQPIRAGELALSAGDWDALEAAAVQLVASTVSLTPSEPAERWLAAIPPSRSGRPGFLLLTAAGRYARMASDPGIDALTACAAQGLGRAGNPTAQLTALALGAAAARARADLPRMLALAAQAADVPGAQHVPLARLLRHGLAGVTCELLGDPEAAVRHFAEAPTGEVPPALARLLHRCHVHALVLSGQAAAAAELAEQHPAQQHPAQQHPAQQHLAGDPDPRPGLTPAVCRWLAGDPADVAALRAGAAATQPGQPIGRSLTALAIATSLGVAPPSGGWPVPTPADPANARDAATAALAAVLRAIGGHDDQAAAAVLDTHLAAHPVELTVSERQLRRHLAVGYVLSRRLREHWDGVPLGPAHAAAVTAARALLAARRGDLAPARQLPPSWALCFLPLAWSAELAVRLAAGSPDGADSGSAGRGGAALAGWLSDRLGRPVHVELRRLARDCAEAAPGQRVPSAARGLLATLPCPPGSRVRISALGPIRLERDGTPAAPVELRRARVRQLLGLLVVTRQLTRDRAAELLWPDLEAGRAGHNLRVTLSHLRRVLEPDRPPGEVPYHLRVDGELIRLHACDWLQTDVWQFERLLDDGTRHLADGDRSGAADVLETALRLWRGDPAAELYRIPGVAEEVGRLAARHATAVLTLGELWLGQDRAREAVGLGEQAVQDCPFDERAHRLVLAGCLQSGDLPLLQAARRRLNAALAELRAQPAPATAILLHQACLAERRERAG